MRVKLVYEPFSDPRVEIDYDDIWLWTGYLRGKYAGRTGGDFIAESFLEVKRYENLPNCWVIYHKEKSWEEIL